MFFSRAPRKKLSHLPHRFFERLRGRQDTIAVLTMHFKRSQNRGSQDIAAHQSVFVTPKLTKPAQCLLAYASNALGYPVAACDAEVVSLLYAYLGIAAIGGDPS